MTRLICDGHSWNYPSPVSAPAAYRVEIYSASASNLTWYHLCEECWDDFTHTTFLRAIERIEQGEPPPRFHVTRTALT